VIEDEKASYPIKRMCELLKASRPGFYRWRVRRGRRPTASQRRRAELDAKVAECHVASDGMYRAPRILADLRAGCERVSRNTVAASLRCPGTGRDQPASVRAGHHGGRPRAVPKDLVRRRSTPGVLNRVWASDITCLRTGQGWLYVCAVRGGCSGRGIGWAVDEHMHTDLTQAALTMAWLRAASSPSR
jgi:putative transposase